MTIELILGYILSLIAVFTAIILHEVAHGYVAYRLGDPTAKMSGRLSLNPLVHIDPIGTILVPLFLVLVRFPFLFGWAKPVPINPNYFRNPFKGMMYVAIAGPGTNIALVLITAGIGRGLLGVVPNTVLFGTTFISYFWQAVFSFLGVFIIINVILALFNMIPIPPLDGSRVLTYFLPAGGKRTMLTLERYGLWIMLGFLLIASQTPLFQIKSGFWLQIWHGLMGLRWTHLLGMP